MSQSGRKRTTRSETTDDMDVDEGHAPQYLIDLLTPLTARLRGIEDFLAGEGHPPVLPPKTLIAPMASQGNLVNCFNYGRRGHLIRNYHKAEGGGPSRQRNLFSCHNCG